MNKKLLILILLHLSVLSVFPQKRAAQNYKGIWQGHITGIVDIHRNTNYVLVVKTQEEGIITGRAYIYDKENIIHESSLDFIGDIDRNTIKITELAIVRSEINFPMRLVCIKFANLKFSNRNNTDYLTGFWTGSTEEDVRCIPGEVYLARPAPGQQNDLRPIPDQIMQEIARDNAQSLNFRETELIKPIIVSVRSRQVVLEIKDYRREDNDTVSVYYNRKLLIDKLSINKQAYRYTIRLDRQSGLNELILYANNLGDIPPNTSQLLIKDANGGVRKIIIESTNTKSAVIYLRYVPDPNYSRLSSF